MTFTNSPSLVVSGEADKGTSRLLIVTWIDSMSEWERSRGTGTDSETHSEIYKNANQVSKLDICEWRSLSTAIFNSDIQLSVYSFSCFIYVCPFFALLNTPLKGGRGFLMFPPCLESQGCQFDPTFLYLFFCSSAQSCCSLCLILFCFRSIVLTSFFLNLHLRKLGAFVWHLVFLVIFWAVTRWVF